jgi:hypothetical protein
MGGTAKIATLRQRRLGDWITAVRLLRLIYRVIVSQNKLGFGMAQSVE